MSKFKAGDLVRSKKSPDAKRRLLGVREEEEIFKGEWDAVDENNGLGGIIADEDITGYYDASTHYAKDATGSDFLDRFFATNSPEAVRGAMSFVMGKYADRLGKKDGESIPKELGKIIDYAERYRAWLERDK